MGFGGKREEGGGGRDWINLAVVSQLFKVIITVSFAAALFNRT